MLVRVKNDAKDTLRNKLVSKSRRKKRKNSIQSKPINEDLLPVLMALVEKHQNYMKFLKDCEMLTPERTKKIVGEIDNVFAIIRSRETGVMSRDKVRMAGGKGDQSDSDENCSSSISSVS